MVSFVSFDAMSTPPACTLRRGDDHIDRALDHEHAGSGGASTLLGELAALQARHIPNQPAARTAPATSLDLVAEAHPPAIGEDHLAGSRIHVVPLCHTGTTTCSLSRRSRQSPSSRSTPYTAASSPIPPVGSAVTTGPSSVLAGPSGGSVVVVVVVVTDVAS